MHPPLTPTPWDGKIETIVRKLFFWVVLPLLCLLLFNWWSEKSCCKRYCQQQGGRFVELDSGGRFDPIWHCVCDIDGKHTRSAQW